MQIKTETKVGLFVILSITIFIFMILGIGVFRFNTSGYNEYFVEFKDVVGLSKKAGVKIAGVEVGWVENIDLIKGSMQAQAKIKINQHYKLYDNAYAVVRQEGLIGTKYLEVIPGDPLLPQIHSGDILAKPGREAVSVDEILYKVKGITDNVSEFTESLRDAFAGQNGTDQLKLTLSNVSQAAEKINNLASSLERVTVNNEDNLHSLIENLNEFTAVLREDMPNLKNTISDISNSLSSSFDNLSSKLNITADTVAAAAQEAQEGMQSLSAVAEKIDDGRGFIGKLINNDEMYYDIQQAVAGMKSYLTKFDNIGIILDAHFESMYTPVDNYRWADSKGYFNFRIHTADDYFYLAQVVQSQRGFISKKYQYNDYYDENQNLISYTEYVADSSPTDANAVRNRFTFAPERLVRERINTAFGLQFGKIYNDLALRIGLFEGSFGFGVDYFLPIPSENFAWIMCFEGFDFNGSHRFDLTDRRPHLKWYNKMFLFNNIYFTVGADDFASKTSANGFWGMGLRFGDDDIKFILTRLGLYINV
ncbi:MCE family protein [bacterium]|nr:MCE family protein [bacterium]NBX78129.1 MCE family protein [bacterium]